ncbi:hypothetical protein EDD17DRAFT_852428 [Pisolithus thermaeus]|nr:hypothetical protein EDD17DRAFT_852428 [Pisolithus thermaeus]
MTGQSTRNVALVGSKEVIESFIGVVSRTWPNSKTQVDQTSKAICHVVETGSGTQVVLWEAIHWRIGKVSKPMTQDMRVLRRMRSSCGIDLVLFCITARISQSEDFVRCYDEVYAKECQRKIPVALVATGLEWAGGNMHGWWEKNKDSMFHLGLAFDVHACITTLRSHDNPCIQEQINISQTRVEALLQIQDLTQQLSHDPICSDQSLEHSGGIPCVPEMISGIYEASLQTRTVVIVGGSGAGKSSIINAIAGEMRAEISSDADTCARECQGFLAELKPGIITELWDTTGWDESLVIEKVARHVQRLVKTRGVDLLLFCVRAGDRVKSHVERFKRKIQPIYGKETTVALVVTGLEDENDMDAWWRNNKGDPVFYELLMDAHACVTTAARSTNPLHQERFRQSLHRLRELVHRPNLSSLSFYELTHECAVIFLIGSTGCGKSQFISTLIGIPEDEAGVGYGLKPRTHRFKAFKFSDSNKSSNSETPVILVDTPGFDNSDPKLTDENICNSMSVWLHEMYKRDITVAGILYLHHATGPPVTAHLLPFVEIYGESVYSRVSLVATMQDDDVDHQEVPNSSHPGDLDQLVSKGAKTFVYKNTPESARELCWYVTKDTDIPRAEHLKRLVSELSQELPNPAEGWNADGADLERLANEHLELLRRIRERSTNDEEAAEFLEQCRLVRRQMADVLAQRGQGTSRLVERVKCCLRTY